MLSGFRSSCLGRLSPPAGKGRAAHHPLEASWGPQVEARCPPIGDGGCGFTSPYYYQDLWLQDLKCYPPLYLSSWPSSCFSEGDVLLPSHVIPLIFALDPISPQLQSFCNFSCPLSLLPACCPISLLPYWSKVLKRNVHFSVFSSFIHTLTHI